MNPELLKRLDPYARRFGVYLSYPLTQQEYVGKVICPESYEITTYLREHGYENVWFQAAKEHPETGQVNDIGLRKVHGMMDNTPEEAIGTGLTPGYHYSQRQWHVHGFRINGYMHLFSHYELRGDPRRIGAETLSEAIERMKGHYRPTYDRERVARSEWTYLRGVACPAVQDLTSR